MSNAGRRMGGAADPSWVMLKQACPACAGTPPRRDIVMINN